MTLDAARLEALRDRYDACFGCGSSNAVGLHLDGFRTEGRTVVAPFEPRSEFSGFEGILHGGIVATALDEISAWSAMLGHGVLVFTATLEIRYRAPARADGAFELRGSVDERRGRRFEISASMSEADRLIAQSTGLFIVAETVET